ncbi:prolipoprotein diacylglyceryl transferase [Candidatus Gracilibacteria bacterium]|nr:prolipoprotein diacylglyceryl transferase [Candidatus Gracilibacteria bacterium]
MIWNLNPIAFSFMGLDVRWYGISYILGFFITLFLGWRIQNKVLKDKSLDKKSWETLCFWIFLFGVIGGRIGHFLFYSPHIFLDNPTEIIKIWQGGMSIHGGIIGAIIFAFFWSKKNKIPLLTLFDALVIPLSLALCLGRISNFINGELVGRVTNQEWGIIFPHIDNLLRHPSQLYEAGKNLIMALILTIFFFKKYNNKTGFLTAMFFFLYGIFRFSIEFFREPHGMVGILTTGQFLCVIMIIISFLLAWSQKFWHNVNN